MAENNETQFGAPATPPDGTIDFTRYDAQQLNELRGSLDRNSYPLNSSALLAELERRASSEQAGQVWTGRLTRRSGFLGWLEAKLRRQPAYGEGQITVNPNAVVLRGWQRTWLGFPIERALSLPLEFIRNVVNIQGRVRFEVQRRGWFSRRLELQLPTAELIQSLVVALPKARTARFERQGLPLLAFEEQLLAPCPHAWLTPCLVMLNVLVFAAMLVRPSADGNLIASPVAFWASNIGPLTTAGQWWRLVTTLFVHANLAHLVLNIWALWSIGRLSERLYGQADYLCLYLGTGVAASLASLMWDPTRTSIGASGAIFGVFGAFLAYLLRPAQAIPHGIFRSHWIPTLLFVGYSLVSGVLSPEIDNAAHVGGLCSGFLLGLLLSRPSGMGRTKPRAWIRHARALAVFLVFASGALWYLHLARGPVPVAQQFAAQNAWYFNGEAQNLVIWNQLASMASAGSISDADLGERFDKEVVPFWETALPKLQAGVPQVVGDERAYLQAITDFVRIRRDWARAIVKATRDRDEEQGRFARAKLQESTAAMAKLERLSIRSNTALLPSGLVNSSVVHRVTHLLGGKAHECIREPFGIQVSEQDSRSDGPALARKAACAGQSLLLDGEYRTLDDLLAQNATKIGDLPDGGSTVRAVVSGLSDLFEYGSNPLDDYLRRLAGWRRAVPNSFYPDLVEASLFRDWAWAARSHGTVGQVSQQAWAAFAYRNEMAWSSLESVDTKGQQDPVWCQLSMELLQDRSAPLEKMRETFDPCVARYPRAYFMYGSMLRWLMPRWFGSPEQVRNFIEEMAEYNQERGSAEVYARLYWIYASLEQDDVNIFRDSYASWSRMQLGFENMLRNYPKSDVILNAYARFACLADDSSTYRTLQPEVDKRPSATGWSKKTTRADCDKKLLAAK
ncbi:MAG: rhomboid family intramembrane serine protease [Gammaproteobacteria bacterium]